MKLTKEQQDDIRINNYKVILQKEYLTRTRKNFYGALPALDHGFVRVVDYMGDA